jgi:hypothetical protein
MNPTKTLPESHSLAWAVDMKKDTRLNILLQLAGMGWFFIFGWLLWLVARAMRPDFMPGSLFGQALSSLAAVLLMLLLVLTLHELVHGAFFLLFTGERPKFGIGLGCAYAAAPDWYFPKGQYLMIGLAPLVLLTVLGLLLIAMIPAGWLGLVFLAVVFNAGGAVGDIYICIRIGVESENIWIKDKGDGFEVYRQQLEG